MNLLDKSKETLFVRREIELQDQLKNRNIIILLLLVVLVLNGINGLRLNRTVRSFVPPQFIQAGGFVQSDRPDNYNVYAYTHYLASNINTWENDAEKDYKQKIFDTSNYTTSNYKAELKSDYDSRINRNGINELRDRTRHVSIISDRQYSEDMVAAVGSNTWLVTLYFNLEEKIGQRVIKNENMKYVYRIIYSNDDPSENQWGLRIDSEVSQERLNKEV